MDDMQLKKQIMTPILGLILLVFSLIEPKYRYFWVDPWMINKDWTFYFSLLLFVFLTILAVFSIPNYMKSDLRLFENHAVVAGLKTKQLMPVWISFPITIIFEELLFRGIILVELSNINIISQKYAILLNGIIFSVYHIHIWFSFKNKKITQVFLIFSLWLGIILGFFLFEIGLFGVIFLHWLFAFAIYIHISKKI